MPSAKKYTNPGGVLTWEIIGLLQSDSSDPILGAGAADRSIQAYGTWGGATLTVQGSNQRGTPAQWFSVHKADGSVCTFTEDGGDVILEDCLQLRVTTGATGDGTTDLDIIISTRG